MIRSRYERLFVAALALTTLVAAGAGAQEGSAVAIRTTDAAETQVTKSNGYLAWSQTKPRRNHYKVFAKPDGGTRFRVNARGTQGSLGSLDGRRLVYQEWTRNDSSIKIMNLATRRSRSVGKANTKHWEFWPRLDGKWLMFVRRSNATQRQVLYLVNLASGAKRVLDRGGRLSYILPGQINGEYVVWNAMDRGKKSKVKRHRISTGRTSTLPGGHRYNWAPSVTRRGTVYFGRSNRLCGGNAGLFRFSSGSVAEVLAFPRGTDIGQSWVYETPEGKIQVFHSLAKCTNDGVASGDLYRFEDPFTVTLTAAVSSQGKASGTVTGPGIKCGSDCTQDFEPGEEVTLMASPAEGSTFDGWSEESCGTELTCTVTVTADMTVTATFRP